MWHDFCCSPVGSAEDSLAASSGGTLHAARLLRASASVVGKDAVGAMAPLPQPLLCPHRLAGRGSEWRVLGSPLYLPKGTTTVGRGAAWACLLGRHHRQKADCSMMRNCDKSMTDL